MAPPESFWGGIKAAVYGIVLSIILVFSLGLVVEKLMSSLEVTTIGVGTIFDIAAPWDMGYTDASFWITILYILCVCPALLGLVVLYVSAVKTQEYDVFGDGQDYQDQMGSSYGPQAVPQYISAEELAYSKGLG